MTLLVTSLLTPRLKEGDLWQNDRIEYDCIEYFTGKRNFIWMLRRSDGVEGGGGRRGKGSRTLSGVVKYKMSVGR